MARETNLSYDASVSSQKRRSPSSRLKSVDQILSPTRRKQLVSNARDLQQNFSICAWAIRRHLDYVTRFTFEPDTGDTGLDRELQSIVEWYSRPENCDVTGRHSLARLMRLAEERRTVDGDIFLVKMKSGHLQPIESDRVRNPDKISQKDTWVHGLKLNRAGKTVRVGVWGRDGSGGYQFQRTVNARSVLQLAYFERFDQVRGVSPLASAINTYRDLYEGFDYALAKLKISQMFGLVLSREGSEAWGDVTADGDGTGYKVDFGKGPVMLDLDPGDKAEIIESKNPSNEFQTFTQQMIGIALKSLDLPFSFFSEDFTNFFGSRSAFIHYEKSAKRKRKDLADMLDKITAWRLRLFVADGTLRLPRGMNVGSLRWSWISDGTPWWNPMQEITADIAAINAGLKTRTQIVRERHGKNFKDIVDTLADEQAYMNEHGVAMDSSGIVTPISDEILQREAAREALETDED